MPRTKIVATLGPASRSPERIAQLVEAGMNVARLNFSHGTHPEHGEVIARLKQIGEDRGKRVAVLQDLSGPKLRIGPIEGGSATLEAGERFTLTTRAVPGDARHVQVSYPHLGRDLAVGDPILLADGTLQLEVEKVEGSDVHARVLIGGELSSHKGINLPTRSIETESLTEKDLRDLAYGLEQGVDYVALSFVRGAEDLRQARRIMEVQGRPVPLVAKIEKHEALAAIEEIIEASDGIMIARGDLGVETPLEQVPMVQKRIIGLCNRAGKPVITATQMLRSMVESPRPTRAEVADVANAILDGTDAVMLSEETAIGSYPVESVRMMARIATDVEGSVPSGRWHRASTSREQLAVPDAVAHAACSLADDIRADAMLILTFSGSTARAVARYRPGRCVVGATPQDRVCRQLALVWGIQPILIGEQWGSDETIQQALQEAMREELIRSGQTVVVTGGVPMGTPGGTNLIRVVTAGEALA